MLALSADVKKMIDDKSKYTDWANRSDIKAELQMDLILILAEHGYPPVPQDDVFKEIFEQAENFKKYEQAESEEGSTDMEELTRQMSLIAAFTANNTDSQTETLPHVVVSYPSIEDEGMQLPMAAENTDA